MKTTRKQLEDNYADAIKQKDLYYIATCELIRGNGKHFKKDGVHLILVGEKRTNGGIVLDMTAGYPAAHYLEELSAKLQNPNGMDSWVAAYRTLLDQMIRGIERLNDVKASIWA